MNAEAIRRKAAPMGLLAVDLGIVVSVIWIAATLTARQDHTVERINDIESRGAALQVDRRLSVVETQQKEAERRFAEFSAQMSRVESKVDRLLERQ